MATHNFFHWLVTAITLVLRSFLFIGVGVIAFLFGLLIFTTVGQPYDLLFGFPLTLFGIGLVVINTYEALAVILSRGYNQNHCPICNP